MIINRIYMKIKIFCRCSFFSLLVGLRTYQHPCGFLMVRIFLLMLVLFYIYI